MENLARLIGAYNRAKLAPIGVRQGSERDFDRSGHDSIAMFLLDQNPTNPHLLKIYRPHIKYPDIYRYRNLTAEVARHIDGMGCDLSECIGLELQSFWAVVPVRDIGIINWADPYSGYSYTAAFAISAFVEGENLSHPQKWLKTNETVYFQNYLKETSRRLNEVLKTGSVELVPENVIPVVEGDTLHLTITDVCRHYMRA